MQAVHGNTAYASNSAVTELAFAIMYLITGRFDTVMMSAVSAVLLLHSVIDGGVAT